jgi:acyl-CoA reductase-like NAD-dependent aldehyde dehydrogenase
MGDARESSLVPEHILGKHFIDGQFVASKCQETFAVHNPKDGSVVADSVAVAGPSDIDAAVSASESAFRGPWSKFTAAQRSTCLLKLAEILEVESKSILTLDSLTTGNPVSLIPTRERNYIRSCLVYYAGWTDKQRGDYLPGDDGFVKLVRHEPLGVCVAINPFNSPVASFILKAAPCLATGNTLIVKPSEKSPLGSLALAPLFELAGFPKGVVQVVTGHGATGELLARHMRVRKISFTGSVNTGRRIQVAAAESNLKRVTLELGGKSPAIIWADADMDNAVTWTVNGILARTGQTCVAPSRVYIEQAAKEAFLKKYLERMSAAVQKIGDPQDEETPIGPLADAAHFDKVQCMIARGKEEADLVLGGGKIGDQGCFIEPTVFLNPKDGAKIYTDEVFGPVAVVRSFTTEDEVVELANATEYGLMAGVFTKDITRAIRMSERIESGVVGINCVSYVSRV